MKAENRIIIIVIIISIFGVYGVSKVTGIWDKAFSREPISPVSENGEYDPSLVKGSSYFYEISDWFDIPLEDLGVAFKIPEDKMDDFRNKDLEELYASVVSGDEEIGNGSVKFFISLYKGIEYELEESEAVYLPDTAVKLLKEKIDLTDAMREYIEEHTIVISNIEIENFDSEENIENSTEIEKEFFTITGKTTFEELVNNGYSIEYLKKLVGGDIENKNISVRDYCETLGIEFSDIKTILEEGPK